MDYTISSLGFGRTKETELDHPEIKKDKEGTIIDSCFLHAVG